MPVFPLGDEGVLPVTCGTHHRCFLIRRLHQENQRIGYFCLTENISVEKLVLYSVALISNIGLLKAEALTDKPNEKEPTFNEEPSPDNNEVKIMMIDDFYVFEQQCSTAADFLERDANIRGYHLIVCHLKNLQKYSSDSYDFWRFSNNLSQNETEHRFEE